MVLSYESRITIWTWGVWNRGIHRLMTETELRIHEDTERGDNDTIKMPDGKRVVIDGKTCMDSWRAWTVLNSESIMYVLLWKVWPLLLLRETLDIFVRWRKLEQVSPILILVLTVYLLLWSSFRSSVQLYDKVLLHMGDRILIKSLWIFGLRFLRDHYPQYPPYLILQTTL